MPFVFKNHSFRELTNNLATTPSEFVGLNNQQFEQTFWGPWFTRGCAAVDLLGYTKVAASLEPTSLLTTTLFKRTTQTGQTTVTNYPGEIYSIPANTFYNHWVRELPYHYSAGSWSFNKQLFATNVHIQCGVEPDGFIDLPYMEESVYKEAIYRVKFESLSHEVVTDSSMVFMQKAVDLQAQGEEVFGVQWFWQNMPDDSLLWRYVDVEFQNDVSFITIPPFRSVIISDQAGVNLDIDPTRRGQPISQTTAFPLVKGQLNVIQKQLPLNKINYAAIRACMGKTNIFPMTVTSAAEGFQNLQYHNLLKNYRSETLVYLNPQFYIYNQPDGTQCADVKHRYLWFPYGANKHFDYQSNRFVTIAVRTVGDNGVITRSPLFTPVDFSWMYRPNQSSFTLL